MLVYGVYFIPFLPGVQQQKKSPLCLCAEGLDCTEDQLESEKIWGQLSSTQVSLKLKLSAEGQRPLGRGDV